MLNNRSRKIGKREHASSILIQGGLPQLCSIWRIFPFYFCSFFFCLFVCLLGFFSFVCLFFFFLVFWKHDFTFKRPLALAFIVKIKYKISLWFNRTALIVYIFLKSKTVICIFEIVYFHTCTLIRSILCNIFSNH